MGIYTSSLRELGHQDT